MVEKKLVRADFGKAAFKYEVNADLQKQALKNLITFIGSALNDVDIMLDAGSGTGFLKDQLRRAVLVELDIAYEMCAFSRRKKIGMEVNGDIENLPFKNKCFDMVFSSLALQWLDDMTAAYSEFSRVLKTGGYLVFTTLGPSTLHEFKKSILKFDDTDRINKFLPEEVLTEELDKKFVTEKHFSENIILEYPDIYALAKKIRLIGARKKQEFKPLSRRKALAINEYYLANYPKGKGIAATWEVHYFMVKKKT